MAKKKRTKKYKRPMKARSRRTRKRDFNIFKIFSYLFIAIFYTIKYIILALYWFFRQIVLGLLYAFRFILNREKARTIKEKKIKNKKRDIERKSQQILDSYSFSQPKIIETEHGDYKKYEDFILNNKSTIGLILGARGSGKTATAMRILENIYTKSNKRCYAVGFKKHSLPNWITIVDSIENIKNNSFVVVDEGGILFSSRSSMKDTNKLLSELLLIARHKDLSILFITQNSSNLEINVIRQVDYLILKKSSLLQLDFERKRIQNLYKKIEDKFRKYKENKGLAYIYSPTFCGFINLELPSFWSVSISKSFRDYNSKNKS